MLQDKFKWVWFMLFVTILIVRKVSERKAGRQVSFAGTPVSETALMSLWGIAVSVLPFLYIFSNWLNFADYPFKFPFGIGTLGTITFLVSIWLLYRSHADLGEMWSFTVEPKSGKKLITKGVYKRIRHPMYSAHLLWGIAQGLLLPNFVAGPLALLLLVAIIILRIPREERELIKEFGNIYSSYKMQTGSILPKLSR